MTRSNDTSKFSLPLMVVLLALSGCNTPQWRVFQSKVPAPLVKSEVQVEAERAGADLVARTVTAPPEIIPVAQKLSESLGAPEYPIIQVNAAKASKEALNGLQSGIIRAQESRVELNEQLAKFDGKKIEGTGVNVFGFAVSLPVLGLIALAIFCPGVFGWLWWCAKKAGKLAEGALTATVSAVQDFKAENPNSKLAINQKLDGKQDEAHKALVRKIKLKLPSK